nr:MAG TPA: hypothetical protein [Caudoviricetes sp.]
MPLLKVPITSLIALFKLLLVLALRVNISLSFFLAS